MTSSSSSSSDSSDSESTSGSEILSQNQINRISGSVSVIQPPTPPNAPNGESAPESSSTTTSDTDAELPPSMRPKEDKKKKKQKPKPLPTARQLPKIPIKKKKATMNVAPDSFEQFKHLFDTREEYDEVMKRSEREKEQIIFERLEQFESRKQRAKIEETLARRERGEISEESGSDERPKPKKARGRPTKKIPVKPASQLLREFSDSESELDAEFHQPTEIAKKKQQKSAMATLTQKRKEKEKKEERKKALNVADVFGKDDSDGTSSSSTSSSSSSTTSSESSDEEEQAQPIVFKPVETMEELSKARASRHFLTSIIHTPFFNDVAIGSYITINHGPSATGSEFRIVQVIEVLEDTPYTVERTRTDKLLKTVWGQSVRCYRLNIISNGPFKPQCFAEWREKTEKYGEIPTMDIIEKKQKQIAASRQINYTPEVVEFIVNEKKKYQLGHSNIAMQKAELHRKRQYLEDCGKKEEAAAVLKEIEQLEAAVTEKEKSRNDNIAHVNWINMRNRSQQQQKFFSGHIKFEAVDKDDPFTRKNERMRVVCGSNKTNVEKDAEKTEIEVKKEIKEEIVESEEQFKAPIGDGEMEVDQKPEITKMEEDNPTTSKSKVPWSGGSNSKNDMPDFFNLHSNVAFDIDLDKPKPTPVVQKKAYRPLSTYRVIRN